MTWSHSSYESPGRLLTLSAELNEAETVQSAVTRAIELVEAAFDHPVASACTYDPATGTVTTLCSSVPSSIRWKSAPDQIPESVVERAGKGGDDVSADDTPEAIVDTDPREPIQAEALVPVGAGRVLRVGVTEPQGFNETGIATIEGIAANLRTTLARIDNRQSAAVGCDVARALFDQSNEATFVSDTDGTLVAVNRAAVELTGHDREALLPNGLPDIAGDTATEPVREHLERTVTGTSEPLTTTLEHAHDAGFTVELTSQPVDVGGTSYVHTIAQDPSPASQLQRDPPEQSAEDDATALRRLNELTVGDEEFGETIERLLSLGCDHFGLDTGILSHVDGDDYEVDFVVDATGSHEAGAVSDLGDTMCDATLAGDVTETVAFADIADTDHRTHPAAENVRAYIAAPVVVDGDTYGTVNFSRGRPRSEAFRPEEKEFVKLVAQWVGTEMERRHRFEELERYETILEAVDDPVYALDADGQFTFVNEATERKFGYGKEMIGRQPSVGMDDLDVERIQERIEGLLAADDRSTTAEFELETADGDHKIVENRLALIGDEEFRGTAGVLRDITDRKARRRQLESLQRAVEEAADGVAILDGEEYTYVDRTHVEMYGFEDKDQLLGNSWRKLYDDDEVERLEGEAFPSLEADGYWRGMVTGSRPDGSTFPAEISLTIIGDGRLVCTVRDETDRREHERELESFQRAVESARDGVAILDGEEYTYVDRTHVEMYGFEGKDQLLGNSWRKLYDDEEIERLEAEAFPALESDGYWRGMVTGSRSDGSTFPAELSLTIVEDGRLVCTVRDETDRRERERELELKERAMDEANVGIQITDPTREDNPLVYVNDGFERMTGYASDDVVGRNPRFLQGQDSDPEQVARLRKAVNADEPLSLELKNYRRDGTPYWSRLSITPVEDEDGTVTNYIGIQQDVTDRVARSQWRQEFLNRGPLMFIETREVDGEAVVDSCNGRFLDHLGYDRGDIEGKPVASLYTTDSMTDLREGGYRDALSGEFDMQERTLVDADGNEVHTLLRAVPRQDGATGTHALFVDISERKEREKRQVARTELLKRAYEVTTDAGLEFEEKLLGLLDAASEHLDLPYGFLTHIEKGDDGESGTQTILEALGSHERLQPGESTPLEESYCRKTIERDGLMTLTHAAEEGWVDDPAYETIGLETYIGGEVVAGDEVYGTVCFASKEPYDRSLDEFDRSFIRLIGRWTGYEIDRRNTREELREQRERLELTLSGTNTGLAEWNLETEAVTWNETLVDIVGREADSFEAFRAAVHPDDRNRVQRELETMLETGDPWVGEFRMLDGDGDALWLRTRATPVYSSGGEPVRILATGTDISEKKNAERERRRNEQRYRSLAQNIPNGAVVTFDGDLNCRLAAGELVPELGFGPSDIPGTEVGSVIPDDEIRRELLPRFRAVFDGERTDRRVEFSGRTLRIQLVPVGDSHGQSLESRGLMLAQDVTEEARREQELYEERERFSLLIESVDEYAFFIVGEEGVIQNWNDGAEHTFGYDAETAIGLPVAELHPEADWEWGLPDRLLQQARIAGESAHEGWRVRADGSEFYADVRYAPLETDDGEFRGYATTVRDMTDKRRERRRTERFVEESDEVVTIVDPDGTVTYVSGSANHVLGYDPDDLVAENLFDYVHPDGREHAMKAFFECVEDSEKVNTEFRLHSPDGEWINVEGRFRNMLDDDAIGGMLVYLRDVTETRQRARRFESIFNGTFQFTGLLEPDGTVVEINEAALEFGGIERDAIVGNPFPDTAWWTHSEAVHDDVVDAIERAANDEFVRYETAVLGADGLATIDFSVKPVTDDDDDVSLLVVEGRDITTQRRQGRHLQVMQRVMRHNIRNDLTKLRGWTQLMSEETDADKRAEQFETVEQILDKWESMAEKMQDIRTVLESQQRRVARQEVETLVEGAVAPVREDYAGVTVVTDVTDPKLQVPATLREAVRELAGNAAAEAPPEATIEVEVDHSTDGWTEILVRDDGPGMPKMEADVLETGEETPLNHGQGLGLWMIRIIVTQAGGDVSVESTADGTEVRLRLPARRTVEHERSAETIE